MRILIVTLPLHTNYGGILQAYALQRVLEIMGHQVVVFDTPKKRSLPFYKWPYSYPKRIVQYFLGSTNTIFQEQYYNKTYSIKSQHTQKFIDKYIHRVVESSLDKLNSVDYDAIIVGSDQIWRPIYNKKIENAFLAFACDWKIKRIAYAASFGTDDWEFSSSQTRKCKILAQKFDAISVRESGGVDLCKNHLNVTAQHVLDPTLLIDVQEYINLFEKVHTVPSKGNLLCYVLDETPEKLEFIRNFSLARGMTPFKVNSKVEDKMAKIEEQIQPAVETWLRGFYDADFIITDSFHACVFSILFNKPFCVLGNKKRGLSRFHSLLSLFSLENLIVSDMTEIDSVPHSLPNDIQLILKEKKEKSLTFLKTYLTNE